MIRVHKDYFIKLNKCKSSFESFKRDYPLWVDGDHVIYRDLWELPYPLINDAMNLICMLDKESFAKLEVNKVDQFNGNILITAVIYDNKKLVDRILSESNIMINQTDRAKRTALYWAVALLRVDIVKLLLDYNADIEILHDTHTALSWAEYLRDNSNYRSKQDKKDILAIMDLFI